MPPKLVNSQQVNSRLIIWVHIFNYITKASNYNVKQILSHCFMVQLNSFLAAWSEGIISFMFIQKDNSILLNNTIIPMNVNNMALHWQVTTKELFVWIFNLPVK